MESPAIDEARARAAASGFTMSSDPGVGALLAVLAAAVPASGRILELGTGCGVGLAWIVHGLGERTDVEVISLEADPDVAGVARSGTWPEHASIVAGDAVELLPSLGTFDLVFADAEGGKWEGLELTITALRPGGILVVDDMTPAEWQSETHRAKTAQVRTTLTTDPRLVTVELQWATGVIVCTRRVT